VDYLLSGRYSARQIAERFGCTVAEAQALIEALDRLELQEMLGEPTVALPSPVTPTKISDEQLLAEVWVDEMGQLRWRFIDAHLTQRYLVDRQRLEEWKRQHGENAELPQLLTALQALNERNGTIAMLLQTLCRLQRDFLRTGNPLDLRPLTQAEVARQIGCHRSVVCRLIKGQWLKTPHGRIALVELFPSRREVIARLHSAFPHWSDRQIADYLRERFGIRLSRRAVTYHRHRADSTAAPLQSASHSKGR
jgi:RNA polymerase sigma-54 factor